MKYVDPSGHEGIPWWNIFKFLAGRAWNNGGLSNADWEDSANIYLPAHASGSRISGAITASIILTGVVAGTMVTTDDGDSGMFFEAGGGLVTPQFTYTVTDGDIFGDFEDASDYQGQSVALDVGSEATPLTIASAPLPIAAAGDAWIASGDQFTMGGYDIGASFGIGLQTFGFVTTNAYPADTVIQDIAENWEIQDNPLVNWFAYEHAPKLANLKFEGPGLLVCRLVQQCGR